MPFKKGKSGNPGGRPKVAGTIREIAQQHGEDAIFRLVELMHDDDKRVALAACTAVLDRGYGKPQLIVESTKAEEILTMIREARERAALASLESIPPYGRQES